MSTKGQSRSATPPGETEPDFSPVDNEPPLRWLRWLHLAPPDGLGAGRRAVFFALLTWLPIVVWAAATGHLWTDATGERLLQHYGVHVRCLRRDPAADPGRGGDAQRRQSAWRRSSFRAVSSAPDNVPDSIWSSWTSVACATDRCCGYSCLAPRSRGRSRTSRRSMTTRWHGPSAPTAPWVSAAGGPPIVVRPIFLALVMGWLWRMLLVTYWVWRVGRLDLAARTDAPRPHGWTRVRREASRGIRDGGICVVGGARVPLGA